MYMTLSVWLHGIAVIVVVGIDHWMATLSVEYDLIVPELAVHIHTKIQTGLLLMGSFVYALYMNTYSADNLKLIW